MSHVLLLRAAPVWALVIGMSLVLAVPSSAAMPDTSVDPDSAKVGAISLLSQRPNGSPSRRPARDPSISADGRYVVYVSKDYRLAGLPGVGPMQVFRHDRQTGETILISATPGGLPGSETSEHPVLSADGDVVVFSTDAADLLPGQPTLHGEVVVARDVSTGTTSLVSQRPDGQPPNAPSGKHTVSADGRLVLFNTTATDITGSADFVLFDRAAESSTAVLVGPNDESLYESWGSEAYLSSDGRHIAFSHSSADLVADDDNGTSDVFVLDVASGDIVLATPGEEGGTANGSSGFFNAYAAHRESRQPAMSADGSRVVFISEATDLAGAPGPGNVQAYVFDRKTGLVSLVSVQTDGSPGAGQVDLFSRVTISANGRFVAMTTYFSLDPRDVIRYAPDVYVRDLARLRTSFVSYSGSSDGNGASVSAKGFVVFESDSTHTADDHDNREDVFLRRVS